jgi:hypothetical protein
MANQINNAMTCESDEKIGDLSAFRHVNGKTAVEEKVPQPP